MPDDIRIILMDRLIRLDSELRSSGKLGPEDNPPFLPVSAEEARLLGATARCEATAFYRVPLRIVT